MADEHLISLQPGTIIAGRYEVVKCLGAGSMGLVYACRHRELQGHLVAVKVLFPEVAQDKIAAARFRNEIFASYGVSHPNVVRAYEYIRDGDLVAYTMEYVNGGDLAERLNRRDQPLSIPEIMHILSEMCSGVQAIHDAGIVHRDLKPENILLTKEGDVKIADFGIARTGHGPKLTEHGGVVGTIDYVSPEYMLNSQVDWRSDIYAIGILGYEMVAGESPFRGDSVYATMTKRLKSDAKPPSALRSECSASLDRIILRAMHRDPEQRYQSAIEMFYDLQELLPEPEKGSGGYSRGGNKKSGAFIGPILETGSSPGEVSVDGHAAWSEAHEALSSSPTSTLIPAKPAASGVPRPAVRRDPPAAVLPNMAPKAPKRDEGFETFGDEVGDVDFGPGSTQELNSSHEGFHEDDTIHEPIRMERMLAYNDLVSQGWGTPSVPAGISITGTGIDENRLRRLSREAGQNSRLGLADVAYIVGAIILGLGLGFTILVWMWPEMGHNATPKESIDLHAVDGG